MIFFLPSRNCLFGDVNALLTYSKVSFSRQCAFWCFQDFRLQEVHRKKLGRKRGEALKRWPHIRYNKLCRKG